MTSLPPRIHRLRELAYDLWWSWTPDGRELFRRLDYSCWRLTAHNPVRMLQLLPPATLEAAMNDSAWLARYDDVLARLDAARAARNTWCEGACEALRHKSIAYFSAEFALHQSLPIYAGGLGVLAGDHCKEASDLGVPLIGVGFMYPQGYFHQKVSTDGWQEESYEKLQWADAPIEPAVLPGGGRCLTSVPLGGGRNVQVAVWRVRIGRVKLYLLDTDVEGNAPWDRELTARLYGGDRETRVQQEIILGIGGVRVLKALGSTPSVYHLNEGHAAFVVLQRIRDFCEQGWSFDDALAEVRRTTVFTTHTPVAAGHDAFPFNLVETHLADAWGDLGAYREKFLALGSYDNGSGVQFNMTALALRTAAGVNGVSQLHGEVTKDMWLPIWPGQAREALPVKALTNGVHPATWVAAEIGQVLARHLGDDWLEHHDDPAFCEGILAIPDEELWAARRSLRAFLFHFVRERARARWMHESASAARVVGAGTLLDHNTLTLGFARRFTGYKRPELIFSDPERLARILNTPGRPVQIVFAGKAHPADEMGKHHLQRICAYALDPRFGGRIAFIDDYDLHVAHFLVQGCDVWLNTPRKPLEASGTSGMKAAMNGTPNLSIGDGWWAEGYTGDNGWLIQGEADPADHAAQDWADAQALYRLLEDELVPMFYDCHAGGVPRRWMQIVKSSMRTVLPRFSTRRMLKEYVREMYLPVLQRGAGKR